MPSEEKIITDAMTCTAITELWCDIASSLVLMIRLLQDSLQWHNIQPLVYMVINSTGSDQSSRINSIGSDRGSRIKWPKGNVH